MRRLVKHVEQKGAIGNRNGEAFVSHLGLPPHLFLTSGCRRLWSTDGGHMWMWWKVVSGKRVVKQGYLGHL